MSPFLTEGLIFVCVLSQKKVLVPFLPFLPILFKEAPSILHALPGQTVFDFFLNSTKNSAILSRTLWTILWLAKTSNKSISLTAWLAVNPNL